MGKIISEESVPPEDPIFSGGSQIFSPHAHKQSTSGSAASTAGTGRPAGRRHSLDALEAALSNPEATADELGLAMAKGVADSRYTPPQAMVELLESKRPDLKDQAIEEYQKHWVAANF